MLDNHISCLQETYKNDCILIICVLKRTRLFKKAHAVFDQGRGFESGEGREFAFPLMAFF